MSNNDIRHAKINGRYVRVERRHSCIIPTKPLYSWILLATIIGVALLMFFAGCAAANAERQEATLTYDGCTLPPPDPRAALMACKREGDTIRCLYFMTPVSEASGCVAIIASVDCVQWEALDLICPPKSGDTL
jgi:hypothetical protein